LAEATPFFPAASVLRACLAASVAAFVALFAVVFVDFRLAELGTSPATPPVGRSPSPGAATAAASAAAAESSIDPAAFLAAPAVRPRATFLAGVLATGLISG
jgi:hypothetical protein